MIPLNLLPNREIAATGGVDSILTALAIAAATHHEAGVQRELHRDVIVRIDPIHALPLGVDPVELVEATPAALQRHVALGIAAVLVGLDSVVHVPRR